MILDPRHRIVRACMLMLVLFSGLNQVTQAQIPSAKELADITTRGRMLFEYDQAAWHASDAVLAMNLSKERLGQYIARKTGSGWEVAFGQLSSSGDAFLIAALATQGKTPDGFTVRTFEDPQREAGFYLEASKGIRAALADFHGANRPYNAAVLPATDGQLWIYLVPAQTEAGDYPLGADVRYLISADGTIVDKRPLHKSIIPHGDVPPGTKMVGGTHSHVLTNVPEDTDVFFVLARKPSMPEYIGTQTAIYCVNPDGSIKMVQRMKK